MSEGVQRDGIAAGRLAPDEYAANFADLHPPLTHHEAIVEADRCYFCYDAPCMNACPTEIDIPLFIREIVTDNPLGAAETIFEQNILGGMCARVCPTETALRRGLRARGGRGQAGQDRPAPALRDRYRDGARTRSSSPAPPSTGKTVAVVGAGPAGLACAHRLVDARP